MDEKTYSEVLAVPPLTEEVKIRLIKSAIRTEAGWQALAESIISSTNQDAKSSAIQLLKEIAGDKTIPVVIDNSANPCNIARFADVLVQQLEYHLALASTSDKE